MLTGMRMIMTQALGLASMTNSSTTNGLQTVGILNLKESRITPGRRQSKTSTLSTKVDKINRNGVFDCHLSPDNNVSIDF